ncbi:MAG TPA: hypothetical protein VFK89_09365 [Actinomycetota bacterium]|nr:hypothetical protein [Actinomycetota bacterium]
MVERCYRMTLRNFSTLFVIVAAIVVPLQLAHAFVFKDVIATRGFHDVIESYPRYRLVHGVGRDQLDAATAVGWVIVAIELVLLPLAVRAARRVFEIDGGGGVTTAPDAWAAAVRRGRTARWERGWIGIGVVGLVSGVVVGLLLGFITRSLSDLLSPSWAWTGVGLGNAVALSAGAALTIGFFALARPAKDPPPFEPIE